MHQFLTPASHVSHDLRRNSLIHLYAGMSSQNLDMWMDDTQVIQYILLLFGVEQEAEETRTHAQINLDTMCPLAIFRNL